MPRGKKQNIARNFGLLVITLLVILLLMEISLRLAYPLYKNYNTEMWRYARDIKMPSKNPIVSHEHAPNRQGSYYGATISTNRDGFRDYEYSLEKSPDAYRILMLGDSITLGWGVEFNKTFPKLIEKKLNGMVNGKKFEAINTGIGNYNTLMEVELLKEKGLKYKPDLIILNYYINDAEYIKKPNLFLYFFQKNLYTYAFFWDKVSNLYLRLKNESYLSFYSRLYDDSFKGKQDMIKSINELAKTAKENNIKLVIVVYPEFHNFKNYDVQYATDAVRNVALSNNLYFLDLLSYYEPYSPKSIWVSYEDAHPNALGNSIAADAITDFLVKKNIVPVKKNR